MIQKKKLLVLLVTLSRVPVALLFYFVLFSDTVSVFPLLFYFVLFIEGSDFLDGFLARKLNVVSDLGKIIDPAADVTSHFLCIFALSSRGLVPYSVLIVFVLREYWILLVRGQLLQRGFVLSAKFGGKIKTVFYAFSLLLTTLFLPGTLFASNLLFFKPVLTGLWYFATLLSLLSAIHYLYIAVSFMRKERKKRKQVTEGAQAAESVRATESEAEPQHE